MNCPDCEDVIMESEQATCDESGPLSKKPIMCVAVNYYCPSCMGYWRWDRGYPLERVMRGITPSFLEMEVRRQMGETSEEI